jgi:DNA-directed RNA polymerase specialized sigma24 family protein
MKYIFFAPKTTAMNYNIENIGILTNKADRILLQNELDLLLGQISYIPLKYRKSDTLEINISMENNDLKISVLFHLTTGVVLQSRAGKSIKDIAPGLFKEFAEKLNSEVEIIRKKYAVNRKNSFIEAISIKESDLKALDDAGRTKLFKSLITSSLQDMIGYVKRRVYSAKIANIRAFNNIFVKDIVSEVIINVHERFQSDITNIRNFNIWNIQEADKVLNAILDKNESSIEEISFEQLVDNELSELEESYTTDAGGDYIMHDEIDDFGQDKTSSNDILTIFIDGKDQVDDLERPDEELEDKIFDELIKLPVKYQSIYDLYYLEHMDIDEIAEIKNMKPVEIEAILISIKELIAERI